MLWIGVILAALLGFVGVALGLRGRRIDSSPVCRRCRFSLAGVYPASSVCPECGSDLTSPKSVRTGQRRRRRGLVACGLVLVLAGAGGGGALGWGRAKGFNWNTVKPVWLLVREGASNNAATADAALKELNGRLAAQKLTDAQRDAVLERALAAQADISAPWRPGWGDFVETLWLDGKLTEEQQRRYARHAVGLVLHARTRVRHGDALPMMLQLRPRTAERGRFRLHLVRRGTRLGEQTFSEGLGATKRPLDPPVPPGFPSAFLEQHRWREISPAPPYGFERVRSEPGRYTLQMRWEVAVVLDQSRGPGQDLISGSPPCRWDDESWHAGTPEAEGAAAAWREELRLEVEVAEPETDTVELVTDDRLRAEVLALLRSMSATVYADSGGYWANVSVPDRELPVPLAFDVAWRVGDTEVRAGTLVLGSRAASYGHPSVPISEPIAGRTVDVVLRPSAAAARATIDLHRIWGEEVVVPGVPVRTRLAPR